MNLRIRCASAVAVVVAFVGVVLHANAVSAKPAPPNLLLILADDLAWSDLGCYGHPWHHTPNLDALAADGVRFTDAYAAAPICSASRAAIMTGKTTARLHFEFVTKNEPGFQKIEGPTPLRAPPFTLNLPINEVTVAEYLNQLGYETAFFGKWHLNAHHKRYLGWSPTHGPAQQGFQIAVEDFGSHPYAWGKSKPESITTVGEFPRDSMIDQVCRYLGRQRKRPFFLFASQFYVHTPVRTPCKWLIDKYERLIPPESPNRDKRIAYAAFVEELDQRVGRILQSVDAAGLRKETLIVFTSDNGGHPEFTANGPLRGSKWNLYEGGIRVPLIASWPGKIAPKTTCGSPVIGYDLLPTFSELAGGKATSVDGIKIADLFERPSKSIERELVWHFPYYHPEKGYAKAAESIGTNDFMVSKTRPQSAIRSGAHKLIYFYEDQRAELYDLQRDPGEQYDLSEREPDLAEKLTRQLKNRLQEANARLPTRVKQ